MPRRKLDVGVKEEALRALVEKTERVSAIATRLGLSRVTVYRWKNKLEGKVKTQVEVVSTNVQ